MPRGALIAAVLIATCGCSLIALTPPRMSPGDRDEPECSTDRVPPHTDLFMAVMSGAVALAFTYGISARTGYQWTARCGELHRKWRDARAHAASPLFGSDDGD